MLRARWLKLRARWVTLRARWVTLRARWVMLGARWVTLRARWVTLRARWVTRRARWVTLRARWVTLRARWVTRAGGRDSGVRTSHGHVRQGAELGRGKVRRVQLCRTLGTSAGPKPYSLARRRERGPGGLTQEVETPLPSNSPHGHMMLRVDLVISHRRWKRPCLQTAHTAI
jgi:hypothetical protein